MGHLCVGTEHLLLGLIREEEIALTLPAQRAVNWARKAALAHGGVAGPEHLLLGILNEGAEVAEPILKEAGLAIGKLREMLQRTIDGGSADDASARRFRDAGRLENLTKLYNNQREPEPFLPTEAEEASDVLCFSAVKETPCPTGLRSGRSESS